MDQVGQKPREGKAVKQVFFTQKPEALYAISVGWPGRQLVLRDVKVPATPRVTMLGVEQPLKTELRNGALVITMPDFGPDEAPCRHAFTLKIEGGVVASEK